MDAARVKTFFFRGLPAFALAGAALIQFLSLPNGYVGKEHDDALYVWAALALHYGEYRYFFAPGRPPIDMTPGLPALLCPVAAVFGAHLWAYQIALWALLALTNVAVWFWLKRRHPPPVALCLALLFALNPLTLARAGVVMPEAPALFVSLLVLLALEKPAGGAGLGAGTLIGYLIRPAALPLFAAVWGRLAMARLWRALALSVLIPVLGAAAWASWTRRAGGMQESRELSRFYSRDAGARGVEIAAFNAARGTESLGATLLPLRWADNAGPARAAGGVLLLLTAAGLLRALKRKDPDPAVLFLIAGAVMHLFWPWWYDRYLLTWLPFILSFAVLGLPAKARAHPKFLGAALGAALAAQFAWQGRFSLGKEAGAEPPLAATYGWIRGHLPTNGAVASAYYGRDALYAARPFRSLPIGATPAETWERLTAARVGYVLWYELGDTGFSTAGPSPLADSFNATQDLLRNPALFAPVFRDPAGGAVLYRLIPATPAAPSPGRPARSLPASAPPA